MDSDNQPQAAPSRSARKRAAQAVETLAFALVELAEADLARLCAPKDILAALHEARATRGHGARKRQVKYLAGRLRRRPDAVAELEAFMAGLDEQHLQEQATFHALEELRGRLCDPATRAEALDEAARRLPGIDLAQLDQLARRARDGTDRHAFRAVFQLLKKAARKP
jgi:ribosome-associated protein